MAMGESTPQAEPTCWNLLHDAAQGSDRARDDFARRYLPVVRSFLQAGLGRRLTAEEVDDAVQEVFLECLREGGLLERAQAGRGRGFRAFLYAACRNVALRQQARRSRQHHIQGPQFGDPDQLPLEEQTLGAAFDRAWAAGLAREAAELQAQRAREQGSAAVRRVELLRQRFQEARPIRDIAVEWSLPADFLHHEYAQARKEFERALRDVIAYHNPSDPQAIRQELGELLALFGA